MNVLDKVLSAISPSSRMLKAHSDRSLPVVTSPPAQEATEQRAPQAAGLGLDPNNDGWRRLGGMGEENINVRRDLLTPMGQDLMQRMAYYLFDTSGMVKRSVRDTRNFALGEGVSYSVPNDTEDGQAKQALDDFWNDSINRMDVELEERVLWLGHLGEQCWPVSVNPHNGRVRLSYVDPQNIVDVHMVPDFPTVPAAVTVRGNRGVNGPTLSCIREELNPRRRDFGRLVGQCFFFPVEQPAERSARPRRFDRAF